MTRPVRLIEVPLGPPGATGPTGPVGPPGSGIPAMSADPVSPFAGQIWFNSTAAVVKFYNGSETIVLGTLDEITAPGADVSLAGHKLTGVADPTGAQDAATKTYTDTRAAAAQAAAQAASDPLGAASSAQAASLQKTANLSDIANVGTSRTNLGLGTAATHAATDFDTSGAAATAQTTAEAYTDTQVAPRALDNTVVHNTGNENVAGTKTFSSAPAVPDGSFSEAKVTNLATDLAGKVGKGDLVVNVKDYGAVGDGTTDDTAAFRSAYTAAVAAGRPLFIPTPPVAWNLASPDGNGVFVTLTKGIPIFGPADDSALIKIGPSVSDWRVVFGVVPFTTTDLSNLNVSHLTFDAGSVPTYSTITSPGRYFISAYAGDNLRVTDIKVQNWDGRNAIVFDGRNSPGITNVKITGCLFENVGAATPWHDHSTVYVDAVGIEVAGNRGVGVNVAGPAPSTAWAFLEVHGAQISVHDNVSVNYYNFGNLVAGPTTQAGTFAGYQWHHNQAWNCATGLQFWPVIEVSDVDIHHNLVLIDLDRWPATGTGGFPSLSSRSGLQLTASRPRTIGLRYEDNWVEYLPHTSAGTVNDSVFWWQRPTRRGANPDTHIAIRRNYFRNVPSSSITARHFASLDDWDVAENVHHNVGTAALGTQYQAGFAAWDYASNVGGLTGIKNLRISREKFVDDQTVSTLATLLSLPAATTRTENVTLNGTTTIADTGALDSDIGSTINGTNIPTDDTINGTSIGVSFLARYAATGSGVVSATITGLVPTVAGVELLDPTVRVDGGLTPPPYIIQASQSVFVRAAVPVFSAPTGNALAGSMIVDKTSGATWAQSVAPVGSNWVPGLLQGIAPNLLTAAQSLMQDDTTVSTFWIANEGSPTLGRSTTLAIDAYPTATMTSTSGGAMSRISDYLAVSPSTSYVASAKTVTALTPESTRIVINWYTSANTFISNTVGTLIYDTLTGIRVVAQGTSPSNAAKARVFVQIHDSDIGEIHGFTEAFFGQTSTVGSVSIDPNSGVVNIVGLTLPVSEGGTGQTTAAAARASSGLNIDAVTTVANVDKTATATDRVIAYTSLTAARTVTLPAANAVNPGQLLIVADLANAASATNTISFAAGGTGPDTIIGNEAIASAGGSRAFISDGTSKWILLEATRLRASANLADLQSAATSRANLNLGAAALLADPITLDHGGTGQTTAAAARGSSGLNINALGLKALPTGRYWSPPHHSASTNATRGNGNLYLHRLIVRDTLTIASLGFELTVVGGTGALTRLGVYNVATDNHLPGTLLLDLGTTDCSASRTTTTDGVTTNLSPNISAADASFVAGDVGRPITGTNIPTNTTIKTVTSSTAAVMSNNATGTASTTAFTIGGIGLYEIPISGNLTLTPGIYFLAIAEQGNASPHPTYRTISSSHEYEMSDTSATNMTAGAVGCYQKSSVTGSLGDLTGLTFNTVQSAQTIVMRGA